MKRTKKGFTLVELIIVIAVIGVLAAILIPTFSNVIDKANAKSALSDARNTVTQYVTEAFENSGLPENIVVIIKKASNYYLYGYNTRGDGSIQISSGNPYKGLSDVEDLVNQCSWNGVKGDTPAPDSGTEYTDAEADGTFYLVPYTAGVADVPIKGFHANKDVDMEKYPSLKDKMTEDMGENTEVFHGILLGGTYTLDSGSSGGSGTVTPPADTTEYATIKFETAELDKSNIKDFPEDAQVPVGTTKYFTSLEATDTTWTFLGWTKTSEDSDTDYIDYIKPETTDTITVYARWKQIDPLEVTLDLDGAAKLNPSTGVAALTPTTAGDRYTYEVMSRDISMFLACGVENGSKIHVGWKDENGNNYTTDTTKVLDNSVTSITLTPVYQTEFNVTYNGNGGTVNNAPSNEKYRTYESYTIPSDVKAAKSGVNFLGWAIKEASADLDTATGTYSPGAEVPSDVFVDFNEDIEFVAVYGFTVTYKANAPGGCEITDPAAESFKIGDKVTLNMVLSDGGLNKFNFIGWALEADATEAKYKKTDAATLEAPDITGNTTLYAVWEEVKYVVTVKLNDTWNGDTVTYDKTFEVTNLNLSIINDNMKNAMESVAYFVPDKDSYTATASGSTATVTITGTRLAKYDGSNYSRYAVTAAQTYSSGDSAMYQVITATTGLDKVANQMSRNYLLNADGLSRTAPLGSSSSKFSGVFDGNNKSVNFSYNQSSTSTSYVGFFSYITGTVKNLSVNNNNAIYGYQYVGALAGQNDGTIDNCEVTNRSYSVNGLYGYGNTYVAGFVGYNNGNISHSTCNVASVLNQGGGDYTGGFTAVNSGTILDCHYTGGRVHGNTTGYYVGGFVGENTATIQWSDAKLYIGGSTQAQVIGAEYVGGFAATNGGTIQYCAFECENPAWSSGSNGCVAASVTSNSAVAYGGFIGYVAGGEVSNCYARIKRFYARKYAGGFIGLSENSPKITNCYSILTSMTAYSTSYAGYDVAPQSTGTYSNNYCVNSSTSYMRKFTQATTDADLKTKVAANSSWVNAGCWDWSGDYVKLKTYADMYDRDSYTLTLDANAPSGISVSGMPSENPITQDKNTTYTLPTLTTGTAGYSFLGWGTSATASSANAGTSYTFTADKTLYGVWGIDVTFDNNSSSYAGLSASNTPTMTATVGHSITVPTPTDSSNTYMFVGWTLDGATDVFSQADSIVASGGASYTPTKPVTLKGMWVNGNTPMIIYLPGTASGSEALSNMPSPTKAENGSATVPYQIPRYIPEGHPGISEDDAARNDAWSFRCWKDTEGNTIYPEDTVTNITGVKVVTAQWNTGYYVIKSLNDLQWVDSFADDYVIDGVGFVLGADINCNNSAIKIGPSMMSGQVTTYGFNGYFNGNGFTISNIKTYDSCAGFFSALNVGAEVRYLTLSNCSFVNNVIASNYSYSGVLASINYAYSSNLVGIHLISCSQSGGELNGTWGFGGSAGPHCYVS